MMTPSSPPAAVAAPREGSSDKGVPLPLLAGGDGERRGSKSSSAAASVALSIPGSASVSDASIAESLPASIVSSVAASVAGRAASSRGSSTARASPGGGGAAPSAAAGGGSSGGSSDKEAADAALTPEEVARSVAILVKPSNTRTERDVDYLLHFIVHRNPNTRRIFEGVTEDIAREIVREVEFVRIPSGQVVFRQGDLGNLYYIILSGSVSVYQRDKELQSRVMGEIERRETDGRVTDIDAYEMAHLGTKVATLHAGKGFGELALLGPAGTPRNATIVADDFRGGYVDFVVVERAVYIRMFKADESEGGHSMSNLVDLLLATHMFSRWPRPQLVRLSIGMRRKTFTPHEFVVRQGKEVKEVLIILSGAAQRVQRLYFDRDKGRMIPWNQTPTEGEFRSSRLRKYEVDLGHVGLFEIIGEEAVLDSFPVHASDIRAVTSLDVLRMDGSHFESFVCKEHSPWAARTLRLLRHVSDHREEWRHQRIEAALLNPELPVRVTRAAMRACWVMCAKCGAEGHLAGDKECPDVYPDFIRERGFNVTRDAGGDTTRRGAFKSVVALPGSSPSRKQRRRAFLRMQGKVLRKGGGGGGGHASSKGGKAGGRVLSSAMVTRERAGEATASAAGSPLRSARMTARSSGGGGGGGGGDASPLKRVRKRSKAIGSASAKTIRVSPVRSRLVRHAASASESDVRGGKHGADADADGSSPRTARRGRGRHTFVAAGSSPPPSLAPRTRSPRSRAIVRSMGHARSFKRDLLSRLAKVSTFEGYLQARNEARKSLKASAAR